MIITRTPLRISFLGGGTDYPIHYQQHGGATLATAINKYTFITVHPLTRFVDHCVRVHYSQVESVENIDQIRHPSARECLRFLNIQEGVEIHYVNDLPAQTGLGSSSSATVGLIMALHAFKGEMASNEQVAQEAIYVEQEMIHERVGSQDQYACALGGFLHIKFCTDRTIVASPTIITPARIQALQSRLLLMYTGLQRHAHHVLEEQIDRTRSGENTADLKQLEKLTHQGLETLVGTQDLTEFGSLLHEGWVIKRRLSSKIATTWIDELYERARCAGAVGGKLLGAGGGGFLLLYVEPDNRERVINALPELRQTDWAFEKSGTRVIFYNP